MISQEDSNTHSLEVLSAIEVYDEFMESIKTLVDLGCGNGQDLEWWATRETSDDNPQPLNINCIGVDLLDQLPVGRQYNNITYQRTDFESTIHTPDPDKFDVLWCHNAFQYVVEPLKTLRHWRTIASENAMLILSIPQTTNIEHNKLSVEQESGVYYHYTMTNLLHMLAITGWDCRGGYFQKRLGDPWITAVVYKSDKDLLDPKTTTWYDLVEAQLLPESADNSINEHGYLREQDLILEWLDHSLTWLGKP